MISSPSPPIGETDTADSYSRWIPGNDSESERIIGRWIKARGNRDKVLVFTKVGSDMGQGHPTSAPNGSSRGSSSR